MSQSHFPFFPIAAPKGAVVFHTSVGAGRASRGWRCRGRVWPIDMMKISFDRVKKSCVCCFFWDESTHVFWKFLGGCVLFFYAIFKQTQKIFPSGSRIFRVTTLCPHKAELKICQPRQYGCDHNDDGDDGDDGDVCMCMTIYIYIYIHIYIYYIYVHINNIYAMHV